MKSSIRFTPVGLLIAILLLSSLSACGGRFAKNKAAEENAAPIVDITRPPVAIGSEDEIIAESDPDKTVSYEEWKKKQAKDE
jgi:hypothetical protein